MSKTRRKRTGPKPPASAHSPARACPAEIWGCICSLACVDDGSTGRSLSRVSKYINEASKPYKYQCLSVKSHQLRPLTTVLRKLPPESRRVIHLFLSSKEWDSGHIRPAEFFQTDKNRLLIVVAPTLKSLEICCHFHRLYLPFVMPALIDLTMHGYPNDEPLSATVTCYPALRRLNYVWSMRTYLDGPNIISFLKVAAPNLSALRLSMFYTAASLALVGTLPLEKVLFQFYPRAPRTQTPLQNKAGRDVRFILLKTPLTFRSNSFMAVAVKNRWTEVCAGHADHWNPAEDEIDAQRS